jgi:two-component system response regulator YesN
VRIYLVDDEQLIVRGLERILKKRYPQYEVSAFTEANEVLDAIRDTMPDLLITDLRMPGMDGMTLLEQVRGMGLRFYAVLTGLSDVELLQQSIRLSVSDYLIKPVNKDELFALVDRVQEKLIEEKKNHQAKNSTDNDPGQAVRETAKSFFSCKLPDESLMARMTALLRSEEPLWVMDRFFADSGREVYFWQICTFAESLLAGGEAAAAAGEEMRCLERKPRPRSADIRRTLEWIRQDYAKELTLAQAASNVYLQANYFSTLFKRETGTVFVTYLNRFRIDMACRKIAEDPLRSFEDISRETGFSSMRYFFSTFKKFTGMTPGSFRQYLTDKGLVSDLPARVYR